MFRAFNSARTKGRNGLASTLAVALAAGTAIGVAGFAEPAYAQKAPKPQYSKAFVAAYDPVGKAMDQLGDAGDYSTIKPQLPGVVAAIENADDRFAAGQLVLVVGNKTNDPLLQRQGLELLLASGKTVPEQVGQFQFFVGNLAYQAQDYAATRAAMEAALAAGFAGEQTHALIIESYFHENKATEGVAYLTKLARERRAAGQQVPESWLVRGLQVAYNAKLVAPSNELATMLVETSPSATNWQAALQVVREINGFGIEENLDIGRLMMVTGAILRDYDLAEYVEAADPRKLPNEVLAALDAATASGLIQANATRFAEFRQIAQERATADREETPGLKGEAQSAASGTVALGVADSFLSFGGYADAEAMYQLAIDKGGIDVNRALTRKGIAQLRQGKVAEAKATFARVQGVRATLAQLWSIYADHPAAATGA